MSRSALNRVWQGAVVFVAVSLLVSSAITRPAGVVVASLFFAAMVLVASFLRVEASDEPVGFEAAVAFPALILFHDSAVALMSVFLGSGTYALYRAISRRSWSLSRFADAAELAISHAVVGLLYTQAVAANAPPMAKVAGYVLLLIGYLLAHLLFASMRRSLEEGSAPVDVRRILIVQGRTLLLLSPIVGIEVMLHHASGMAGFAIGFLPVLLFAYMMRNESEVWRQNVDLSRRNKELAIVTESSTQILSAEDDAETLRRLMALLSKLARMKACAVVTWEANPDVPGTVYRFGECLRDDQEILRWVDSAGFAQSAPSRAFVFQSDMRKFPLSSGSATQVLIGLQTPEVIYGVLIFETEDLSIVRSGSLNLLTLLVSQTALSLQDQLLRREMREKTIQLETNAATMQTILQVSNGLIGQFDADSALTNIAQAIHKALGFEVVVFATYDAANDEFLRRAHFGLDDLWEEMRKERVSAQRISLFFNQEFRVSNSFFVPHSALRQSDTDFVVRPEEADDLFLGPDLWHDNDMLFVPLMSGEQVIGYLSVRHPHDRRIPSIEKVQTLEIFATQAVTALQSARQYEEIKRLTIIDPLTPAYNHRHFQQTLAKEIHRHARSRGELALAMVDIDNFKKINDTFGHPIGDEILKGLVDELMMKARDTDVIARYGGEEFAIILPDTPASSARDAADRLRELVSLREFSVPHLSAPLRVTVSVGVAVYPRDGMTAADLISRADAALYHAKKMGKNRVVVASDGDEAAREGAGRA